MHILGKLTDVQYTNIVFVTNGHHSLNTTSLRFSINVSTFLHKRFTSHDIMQKSLNINRFSFFHPGDQK